MIIVTTSEPSFMGGMFDDEETKQETHSVALKLHNKYKDSNPAVNENENIWGIYFDGELEDIMGFDIVTLVAGTVPKLKIGDKIDVNNSKDCG